MSMKWHQNISINIALGLNDIMPITSMLHTKNDSVAESTAKLVIGIQGLYLEVFLHILRSSIKHISTTTFVIEEILSIK